MPGDDIVLPRPVRGGEIGLSQLVFRRISRFDRDGAVLRQQQHHPHVQHQGGLVRRGPEHVVERTCAGQLATKCVKQLRGARACRGSHRLHTGMGRNV